MTARRWRSCDWSGVLAHDIKHELDHHLHRLGQQGLARVEQRQLTGGEHIRRQANKSRFVVSHEARENGQASAT